MNRHQRRAAAAGTKQDTTRADALRTAMDYLRAAPATATGATMLLPNGDAVYVSRETVGAMADPGQSLAGQYASIHKEAAGLLHLDVVLRDDLPRLVAAAARGDVEAMTLLPRIRQALAGIMDAPPDAPKLCAVCPQALDGGRFALALATPGCDDPSNALALAVCDCCASTSEEVRAKAVMALRRIWPDLRPVTITHPHGGRA